MLADNGVQSVDQLLRLLLRQLAVLLIYVLEGQLGNDIWVRLRVRHDQDEVYFR